MHYGVCAKRLLENTCKTTHFKISFESEDKVVPFFMKEIVMWMQKVVSDIVDEIKFSIDIEITSKYLHFYRRHNIPKIMKYKLRNSEHWIVFSTK